MAIEGSQKCRLVQRTIINTLLRYVGPYSGSGLCALYPGPQGSLATSIATPLCSHMIARTKAIARVSVDSSFPAFLGLMLVSQISPILSPAEVDMQASRFLSA